jgi:hypothetical protein
MRLCDVTSLETLITSVYVHSSSHALQSLRKEQSHIPGYFLVFLIETEQSQICNFNLNIQHFSNKATS